MEKDNWQVFRRDADPRFSVESVVETPDCKVLKVLDPSGDGLLTLYPVFDGVYLMYCDFHMQYFATGNQNADTILCLEHCREGRAEVPFPGGACFLEPGDLRIDQEVHHQGVEDFPLSHYHGITIGFEKKAEAAICKAMPEISVNFEKIGEKYQLKERPYVLSGDEGIERIFQDLYHVPSQIRKSYFQLKIMELLLYLSGLEVSHLPEERPYFYASQVEKTRAVEKLITENLDQNFTIAELARRFELSETALKNCFRSMYGNSLYAYLKEARMNRAASLLLTDRERKISDIALSVGYSTPGKFSVAFKSVFGKTPGEYRRKIYPESRMQVDED